MSFGPKVREARCVARDVPFAWKPDRSSSMPLEEVPAAALPTGLRPAAVFQGRQRLVVIVQSLARAPIVEDALVFRNDWSRVGAIKALPLVPGRGQRWLTASWSSDGRRLAVLAYVDWPPLPVEVGTVDQDTLRFESLCRVEEANLGFDLTSLIWARDQLVAVCPTGSQHLVLVIDPAAHTTKRIYAEEATLTGPQPPYRAAVRPDGLWLAFDRNRVLNNIGPPERSGVSLLDLRTGSCEQLTHENGAWYYHGLVGWEDNRTLLVSRAVADGKSDIYRLALDLPG